MTQRISTSADGSVNGKKLGRKRSGFPSPNIIRQNSVSNPFRSAIVVLLSTANPSTWWNIGLWVTSESQRYTAPGAITRTGGRISSIARIWIGDVCVRRTRSPPGQSM